MRAGSGLEATFRQCPQAASPRFCHGAVVSAIFLPLTLIAGVYGMNFEYVPELKSPVGYFVVLGAMASIAIALVGVFHRVGWLGRR